MSDERPILTLAHSPDADDLVMWWPLVGMTDGQGRALDGPEGRPAIDTGRFRFRCIASDVQELNRRAIERADLDITAISAHAYPHVKDRYAITSCAGSFGDGYGPKLVVREGDPRFAGAPEHVAGRIVEHGAVVAVPGVNTTAFLVMSLMVGRPFRHEAMLFSEVIGAVASGEADAGLLIHEAQLTHVSAGLREAADLGRWWKDTTGMALPLGLNVVKRDLDARFGPGSLVEVARTLGRSVRVAMDRADASRRFLLLRSGERPEWRDDDLVRRYLRMYVSALTRDMGVDGRRALAELFERGRLAGLCPDAGPIDVV